ncbi:thioredoxin family protein [Deinococcus enclensis]|uniref:Thioredoxin 1 n=1 Tax=Deinococcus enclensis TaxID=1049582 RepID=A0ABT9MHV2_9DEIO|nr:thioredoxin family protein [Deinococcus enclensis]MDP9766146.1 thioredoxin 1 [Deinococcus enclensis]
MRNNVQPLTDADFDTAIQEGKWVVHFTSKNCHPCKPVKSILAQLSNEIPGVSFAELNANENLRTVMAQQVSGYPTVIFYVGGRPVDLLYGSKSAAIYHTKAEALANRN